MTAQSVRNRSEVPVEYTWDLSSIFATNEAWRDELQDVRSTIAKAASYNGRLGDSAETLYEALQCCNKLRERMSRLFSYAHLQHDMETSLAGPAAQFEEAISVSTQLGSAISFIEPELLGLGEAKVTAFIGQESKLATYEHYFHNLFRLAPHVRSGEVEQVLALAAEPLGGPDSTYRYLTDTDLTFGKARDSKGQEYEVAQGNLDELITSSDRTLRQSAWEVYYGGFFKFRNSLTANYAACVKGATFNAKVRAHSSSLQAALKAYNIPLETYETTLRVCAESRPIWHRYFEVKRQALKLDKLHPCDIFAPLNQSAVSIPYEGARDIILAGMQPLGKEYVEVLKRGLTQERWVDVYPTKNKRSNAYSAGTYGTHPFLLLNFSETLSELSTFAHELGHSMHTYFTNKHQPFHYGYYSMFVAEVASNFNQAMVRQHLLKTAADTNFKFAVLDEAFYNLHRYLLVMPILGEVERFAHAHVEKGGGLTADLLGDKMQQLLQDAYGPAMDYSDKRASTFWSTFGHFYVPFYVFQYSTGIAAAHKLSERVLSGGTAAAEDYLNFLKAGDSLYPVDALKLGGVDMTTEEPLRAAFRVLNGYIDQLEALLH